jgi:hypothetical protein
MLAQDTGDILASDVPVSGDNASSIQKAIDGAKTGDTIDLGKDKTYNVESQISIYKQVNIKGDNVEITGVNVFHVSVSDITMSGVKFTNPNPAADYRGTVTGTAVSVAYQTNIMIDNCSFINYHSGVYLSGVRDSTVKNCYFTGVTTGVVPDSSDSGTKALNIMGSSNLYITNNTFEGQILDAVSIASTSSNIYVENNTFINNTYAIFYGGASTEGNIIRNNRFITCGMINTTYYSTGLKRNVTFDYSNLPVISLQKASSNIKITDNTFTVKDGNLLILSEAENTAHGFPSVIGGIDLTGNTVQKADSDVNGSTVTFYHINVLQSLGISPVGDINVKNNNFTDIPDIQSFKIDFAQIHVDDTGNVYIPQAKTATKMTVTYVKDGRVVIELTTSDDREIEGAKITYKLNGASPITDTTDEYGHIYINDLAGETVIEANYAGSAIYGDSSLKTTIDTKKTQSSTPSAPAQTTTPAKVVTKKSTALSIAKKTFKKKAVKKLTATLKSSGKAVKGKQITFKVNGKTYKAKTNAKGVATVKIKLTKKGTYKYTAKFAGDSTYKAVSKTNKIKVK